VYLFRFVGGKTAVEAPPHEHREAVGATSVSQRRGFPNPTIGNEAGARRGACHGRRTLAFAGKLSGLWHDPGARRGRRRGSRRVANPRWPRPRGGRTRCKRWVLLTSCRRSRARLFGSNKALAYKAAARWVALRGEGADTAPQTCASLYATGDLASAIGLSIEGAGFFSDLEKVASVPARSRSNRGALLMARAALSRAQHFISGLCPHMSAQLEDTLRYDLGPPATTAARQQSCGRIRRSIRRRRNASGAGGRARRMHDDTTASTSGRAPPPVNVCAKIPKPVKQRGTDDDSR